MVTFIAGTIIFLLTYFVRENPMIKQDLQLAVHVNNWFERWICVRRLTNGVLNARILLKWFILIIKKMMNKKINCHRRILLIKQIYNSCWKILTVWTEVSDRLITRPYKAVNYNFSRSFLIHRYIWFTAFLRHATCRPSFSSDNKVARARRSRKGEIRGRDEVTRASASDVTKNYWKGLLEV